VIKATVLLVIARILIPRLDSRSAAERHLLWIVTLAAASIVPLLEHVLPAWRPEWAADVAAMLPIAFDTIATWGASSGTGIVVRATGLEPDGWMSGALTGVWLVGTLFALAFLTVQFVRLRRTRALADRVYDPRLLGLLDAAAHAVGVRPRPQLMQASSLAIPITWGVRRACVLLPASAATWTDERLRAVFSHELAHIRRRDWWLHLLAEGLCAIYWFDPLFWLAKRQLHREAERAADDVVLSIGIDGHDYATHLLEIVRGSRRLSPTPTIAMARAADLPARIASLLRASTNRRVVARTNVLGAAAIAVLIGVPVGAFAVPAVGSDIQVRTANLPLALLAAISPALDAPASAVRNVRPAIAGDGTDIVAPEVIEYTTPPLYSDEARERGIEGVVVVRTRVDLDGRAMQTRVVTRLGYGLDQNALVALRHWRFRPGARNGVPAAMDADVEIAFSLRQERLNELIANDMAMQVGPDVIPPRAVLTPQPPPSSGAHGTVALDVVLLEDGRPRIIRVLHSVSRELDEAAVQTFERWRFSPAMKNGVPVKVRLTAEVNFHG
jgi:TonB family protein